jgi:hypothetical protein
LETGAFHSIYHNTCQPYTTAYATANSIRRIKRAIATTKYHILLQIPQQKPQQTAFVASQQPQQTANTIFRNRFHKMLSQNNHI